MNREVDTACRLYSLASASYVHTYYIFRSKASASAVLARPALIANLGLPECLSLPNCLGLPNCLSLP